MDIAAWPCGDGFVIRIRGTECYCDPHEMECLRRCIGDAQFGIYAGGEGHLELKMEHIRHQQVVRELPQEGSLLERLGLIPKREPLVRRI